jgi:hypothetical protein
MKKVFLTATLAVGILFSAISAQAEENFVDKFHCSNDQGQSLVVAGISGGGPKALITLKNSAGEKIFQGAEVEGEPDPFFSTWSYLLSDDSGLAGILEMSSHISQGRGGVFCGRAGCNTPSSQIVKALLKQGDNETSFDCQ